MRTKYFFYGALVVFTVFASISSTANAKEREANESQHVISSEQIICSTNSEHAGTEITKAFDGDRDTFWDSAWYLGDMGLGIKPIIVNVEFAEPKNVTKMVYTPRQDNNPNGMILNYSLTAKTEDGTEIVIVENGMWENNAKDKEVVVTSNFKLTAVSIIIKNGSLGNDTSETAATAAEFTFYESIQEVGITQKSMALTEEDSKVLRLTDISGMQVVWESNNVQIASVDKDGVVSGKKEGTATITGTTEQGETASCEVSVSSKEAPILLGKELVFEDSFNGNELDTTKWNNWCVDLKTSGLFRYGNSPEVAVHPDNAYVKNGTLRLLGNREDTTFDGQTSNYRSGMVQTRDKFEGKYGYVEAMVKIPDVPGSNPAVWTMPQADEVNGGWLWGDKDKIGAEIDILERPHPLGAPEHSGLTEKYWVTMHYDNYTYDLHPKYHIQPEMKNPYKWHKFGMEWTPEKIDFMLDGQVVGTQKNDVPNTPEIFILSYGLGGWIGQIADENLPAEMEVDYVRWYRNIESVVVLE